MIPASTQREMSVEAWVHGIISVSWALEAQIYDTEMYLIRCYKASNFHAIILYNFKSGWNKS